MNDNIIYFCPNKFGNPWIESSSYDCWSTFMIAVLGSLISIDNNGNIKPSLLESFDWDFEKNYYKLRLKENLYFHNGRKVTIEDLEFSILRSFFSSIENDGIFCLFDLKGIDKIKRGQPYKSGLVEGLQILDDRTVSFVPAKFNPVFLYRLARAHYSLVPREEYQDDLMTWKKWPVGAGAYKITGEDKKNKGYYLSLVDKKRYPKAPKKIFYEQEWVFEPDITTRSSISENNNIYDKEQLFFYQVKRIIEFNFSSYLGKNKDFRKAVSLALKRKVIADSTDILTKPLYEIIPHGNIGRINVTEKHDLYEASKLFKKVLGANIEKVFKIPYSPDHSYLGGWYREIIKMQFEKAGLKVNFYEIKSNIWDIFLGDFINSPFCIISKIDDFSDPRPTFFAFSKKFITNKSFHFDDKMFEKLLEDARNGINRSELNEKLKNISWYFHENSISIPILEVQSFVYYNPKKIASIGVQISQSIFYLHNLEVES